MAAIKSYKGFDKNLKCRDFQYEIGKEYEMDGEIKVCNRGFHACESPFDVFDHYTMIDSRFCEVEQDGNISKEDRGTKICSSKIKIKAELKLADMINLGVEWLKEITSPEKIKTSIKDNSSGNGAKIGSSGDGAKIGSSGYGAKIGSSGNNAQIGSSGDGAKIGSSGNNAQIGSSGNNAQIGSSGYNAKIDSTGEDCVIMCAGINSVAKASKGSWITLSEWSYSDKKQRYIPVCVKTEFVDGEKIKADTYYKLDGGVFKEMQ
ncbi:MAG: hypothetical protein [Bacteriophage sp.]|nr:MAG: hypothetical protein [Bacteriophage sp.]